MFSVSQTTLPDGRDVVAACPNSEGMLQKLIDVVESGAEQHIFTLATPEISIGVSTGVAIYAFARVIMVSMINKPPGVGGVNGVIRLGITRFCELTFHTGHVLYSFGNMGGKDPVVVLEEDVTPTLRGLIGKKLKDVVLCSQSGKVILVSWNLREK